VATAYLYRSAAQLAEIAAILGRDGSRWSELAANVKAAWQAEYVAGGRLVPETQATYARALSFGLLPDELVQAAADRLAQLVREAGTHVGTGFLATPLLLPALADHGHLDVAYDLLLQRSEPSWLCMLDRGATTVWEAWNGLDDKGTPFLSLNHYSKGAVISFLHQHVAGLRQVPGEPAYRRFDVEPRPGGGLSWAEATCDSPYGPIRAAWQRSDEGLHVEVTVPPGTSAELRLPGGAVEQLAPGSHVRTG
jgi:alpha-L-rhamnosidase